MRPEDGLREALGNLAEIQQAATGVHVGPDSEGYGDLAHVLDLRVSLVTAEASVLGISNAARAAAPTSAPTTRTWPPP